MRSCEVCNSLYKKLVAARADWLWGAFDLFPSNVRVDVSRDAPGLQPGDVLGGVAMEYKYSTVFPSSADMELAPKDFVENVIHRQVRALNFMISEELWERYDRSKRLRACFRPPLPTKTSILLEGSLPLRWDVFYGEDGRAVSLVDVFFGVGADA